MCGRYGFVHDASVIGPLFNVETIKLEPRYNVAPSQEVPIIRLDDDHTREMALVQWGLLPHWVRDPKDFKASTINARADKVAESPAYREPFKRRRCLIPISFFYEWRREGSSKQPYLIRFRDERPFALAGIWDRWDRGEDAIESCAIITTNANEVVAPIHERMPVILPLEAFELWLGEEEAGKEDLLELLKPYPHPEEMEAYPVSPRLNSPRNEGPQLITPQS